MAHSLFCKARETTGFYFLSLTTIESAHQGLRALSKNVRPGSAKKIKTASDFFGYSFLSF
jgi:hypothetical protein